MNISRRIVAVLLVLLALPLDFAHPAEEKATEETDNPLGLAIDPRAGLQLQAAADYVKEEDWKNAIRLLQHLLDGPPGALARLAGRDGKADRYVGVHAEAERLLAVMPDAGRAVYQQRVGPRAAAMLEQARKDRDADLYARIVSRYLYTEAGAAALQGLARRHYQTDQFHFAAHSYAKLIEHLGLARWTNDDLYQATTVFHRRSTSAYADRTLKQLLARSRQNVVRVGKGTLTVEQLRKEIERAIPPRLALEWPIFGGNVARSAQGAGSPPLLEPTWRRSMFYQEDFEQQNDPAALQRLPAFQHLREAEKQSGKHHRPILSAFSPIAVTINKDGRKKPLLIYKNYWGMIALDVKTNEIAFAAPSSWNLQRMLSRNADSAKMRGLNDWLNYYINQDNYPQILFDNSTVGTLSSDGDYVYVVADFAVPPPVEVNNRYPADIPYAIRSSRLQAYSLQNAAGKLAWELGDNKGPLADCYFLGPPLPLDGLLYMLVEKKQELCLLCVDPGSNLKIVSRQPKIVLLQPLVRTRTPLAEDPYRRIRAVHLAYSDGILVCPTNTGVVLGIDLLSGGLAWAYPYRWKGEALPLPREAARESTPCDDRPEKEHPQPSWAASAPVIAEGKIVFTPPDAPSIHCLNLKDGSLVWSRKKKVDELYLAGVHRGKVLIVGTNSVRGVSLDSGATLWTLETGTPSGRGILGDGVYYLPIKESIRSKRPEILALDASKGQIVAHIKSRPRAPSGDDFETPGNLLFFEGEVISLTPWEIVAYPQLKTKIDRINERLERNSDDPAALTERAAVRLDQGEAPTAIEDLRHALKNKPDEKTRQRVRSLLFEALTDLFRRNLGEADKYLKEYEETSRMDLQGVPEKGRARRRMSYFLLVARLRASQGRMREALQAYLDLAALGRVEEMVSPPDEPLKVRRDIWVRGRIAEMYKKATPEQRKQLEEEMTRRLTDAQKREDERGLRDFVALFGPDTAAGREAALRLAERLLRQRQHLEAELVLQEVRRYSEDSGRAARAVEMLGQLMTAQGLLLDAVYYYRVLRRDFGAIKLPGGTTGAEMWDALSSDKRFLPYLDEIDPVSFGKFRARKEIGDFPLKNPVFRFEHDGEALPFFRRRLLGLDPISDDLRLVDRATGEEHWQTSLRSSKFHFLRQQVLYPPKTPLGSLRFWHHTIGTLVVLPVGPTVFAIDPIRRRVLWEKDLGAVDGRTASPDPPNPPRYPWKQAFADGRDGGVRLLYPDGWSQYVGRNLVLSPSVLCLPTHEGLQAFDPRTGRLLWTRSDVPENLRIFGDDKYVFLVEENADGEAVSTRVLRLADGSTVQAPGFAELFSKRVQVFGRTLLLAEKDAEGSVMLRQHDIATGADVWKAKYRPKSIVTRSEDSSLAGVVEPDGKVHVVDLRMRKEVMAGRMEKEDVLLHLRNVQTIHLLHDLKYFYLAYQAEMDIKDYNSGDNAGLQANVTPQLGIRGVPVNGPLYVFERGNGEIAWIVLAKNQFLILDRFQELPVVFLTARAHGFRNTPQEEEWIKAAAIIAEKRSGKLIFEDNDFKMKKPFYAVRFHPQTGAVDFVGPTLKIAVRPVRAEK